MSRQSSGGEIHMKITGYARTNKGKWLNLFKVAYTDKNGKAKTWEVVSRKPVPKCVTGKFDPPDAVVVVPYHKKKDKMVIIREYRVALNGYEYALPAGLIDDDESVEETSRRELKEETGLDLTRVLKVSPPLNATAGMADENFTMVYCECEGHTSAECNEGTETIETILLSRGEAVELLNDDTATFDVKLWLVLSHFIQDNISCYSACQNNVPKSKFVSEQIDNRYSS